MFFVSFFKHKQDHQGGLAGFFVLAHSQCRKLNEMKIKFPGIWVRVIFYITSVASIKVINT